MRHTILEQCYEERFIDDTSYPPTTALQLRGIAAAIQHSHAIWRPTLSELIALIRPLANGRAYVAAGGAYGAAIQIGEQFPGAAILLFGAALNAVGDLPDVDLHSAIASCIEKLATYGLVQDRDISAVLEAARQRAQFDKVGEMLRRDFRAGLVACGRYASDHIDKLVPRIVNATHRVRHDAVVDLEGWAEMNGTGGIYIADGRKIQDRPEFTDPFFQVTHPEKMMFGKPLFNELLGPARDGCSFSLMLRVSALASSSDA